MIKSEVTDRKKVNDQSFPRLVQANTNNLVLVITSQNDNNYTGTVVRENNIWDIGEYAVDWAISHFKNFDGCITLSNEVN